MSTVFFVFPRFGKWSHIYQVIPEKTTHRKLLTAIAAIGANFLSPSHETARKIQTDASQKIFRPPALGFKIIGNIAVVIEVAIAIGIK